MREIKFRGRNYDGIWMYGYLMPTPKPEIHLGNKHLVCACPEKISRVDIILYEVEENTIGQYTGLKDKNGKEIYEGDIIFSNKCDGRAILHKVEYNEENAMFVAKPIQGLDFDFCQIHQSWIDKYGKEVIGNIYDNPELIKEE